MYRPTYRITSRILQLLGKVTLCLGEINALNLIKPPVYLRKKNRIRSLQASLAIEGNTLTLDQVTDLIEQRRVIGNRDEIREVQNAIKVYDSLETLKPHRSSDLLKTHATLMDGLINHPGKFRRGNVGIIKGSKVAHLAPPAELVTPQIKQLLNYVKDKKEPTLLKGCVFHYEFEFIHPFEDGNGRMGRLWQTLIFMQEYPVFEYVPIEQMIKAHQHEYYDALARSDREGESTRFVEYMLERIHESLEDLLQVTNIKLSYTQRIQKARVSFQDSTFSRKEYLLLHKTISSATASRDLKKAHQEKILTKEGDKRTTMYQFR